MSTSTYSRYLSAQQMKSLERVGDACLPRNGRFPAFSDTGCVQHVDVVLAQTDPDDRRDLALLLSILRWAPRLTLVWLFTLIDRSERFPEVIASGLRLLNLGLKGLCMSLYYSGQTAPGYRGRSPTQVIDFELHCEPDSQSR